MDQASAKPALKLGAASVVSSPESGYFSLPDGDFVVRSSDGVDFRVDAAVLKRSSGFFESLLLLPKPSSLSSTNKNDESQTNEPLLMEETASVLDALFITLYRPISNTPSSIISHSDLRPLLRAVDRLEITAPAVTTMMDEVMAELPALQAWALAVTYHRPAARKSAVVRLIRECSIRRNVFIHDVDFPDLECISARTFSRLLRLHHSATRDATDHLMQLLPVHDAGKCPNEGPLWTSKGTGGNARFHRLSEELQVPPFEALPPLDSCDLADYTESQLLARQTCTMCAIPFVKRDALQLRDSLRDSAAAVIEKYATEESSSSNDTAPTDASETS